MVSSHAPQAALGSDIDVLVAEARAQQRHARGSGRSHRCRRRRAARRPWPRRRGAHRARAPASAAGAGRRPGRPMRRRPRTRRASPNQRSKNAAQISAAPCHSQKPRGSSADREASSSSAAARRSKSRGRQRLEERTGDGELGSGGRWVGGVHAPVVRRGRPGPHRATTRSFGQVDERFDQSVLHREERRARSGW